ncbi:hypothetical protein [Nonomuraea basaltis]|uniref:hypothetical protein n=1 Tax=Nonomuraea basaltis TaxID=2495887 RepID=UPI00110C45C9|nr:hypothetical protein [Nonomuraea basaltis]TMR95754.1 hypothetical protein EJK15_26855 [Nonomuraea basaltis]
MHGLGYYDNVVTTVQHNWNDIYNMYRNSHHAAAAPEVEATETGMPQYSAVWRYQPKSVPQAVRMGKAIVRGARPAQGSVPPSPAGPPAVKRPVLKRTVSMSGQRAS